MKKLVVVCTILFVAALAYRAGERSGNGSSGAANAAPADTPVVMEPEEDDALQSPGAVRIDTARRQLIGVKVAKVEQKPMTYALRLYGRVVADETKTYRVNASTDCWIRQLSDVTTGSIVHQNQVLAEALSPAYYNAEVSYLIALDNLDRIKRQLGGQLRHQQGDLANNQIRVAVQALQNLGITDAQTAELANTRRATPYLQVRAPSDGVVLSRNLTLQQWLKAGDEFYTIADLGKVWIYADVYEDEAIHMHPGMAVRVRHAQMGATFAAVVGEVLPLFDAGARTLKVRIDVDNPRYDLRPDMFVDVEIPISLAPALHVPADAILDAGTRSVVYVDRGNGNFEPRRVATGWRLGGQVQIKRGLAPGEKIAVSGNFLIDSESRMELAAMGGNAGLGIDPVCGRYVDAEEAAMLDLHAEAEGRTFYFHSEQCKQAFEKEPRKYIDKQKADRLEAKQTTRRSAPTRSWADLLGNKKGAPVKKAGIPHKHRQSKGAAGKYPTTPEAVDWSRPEKQDAAAPKWHKDWGGFPGAKYLGIHPKASESKTKAKQPAAPPVTDTRTDDQNLEEQLKELEKSFNLTQPPAAGRPAANSQKAVDPQ